MLIFFSLTGNSSIFLWRKAKQILLKRHSAHNGDDRFANHCPKIHDSLVIFAGFFLIQNFIRQLGKILFTFSVESIGKPDTKYSG